MPKQTEKGSVHAARRGYALHKWVNDKTPGADAVVLTDATLYFDIPEGYQVMITAMHFDIETVSDDCHFLLVQTAEVTAAGAVIEISGHAHVFTPAAMNTMASKERPFDPPICIKYSAVTTPRCISMKVDANDASAVISCGWTGWYELET